MLLWLWLGPMLAVGENSPPQSPRVSVELVARWDQALQAREPEWVVERSRNSGDYVLRVLRLRQSDEGDGKDRKDKKGVSVQVFARRSDEEASSELRRSIVSTSVPGGVPLEGLGDEAYRWENYNGRGATTLRFRKATLVIWVSAPSPEVCKRFARHMEDALIEFEGANGSGSVRQ
jgi:hypothetical protein